VLIAMLVADVA